MVTLPPGYRIDDSSAATFERHFPRIASTLTSDSRIYWDKFRDAAVLRLQAEQSFRCVCLVYDGEEGEELAGWVRVVSDGIRYGYLADVFITPAHTRKGLAALLVQDAVLNTTGVGCSADWQWSLVTGDAHALYRKPPLNFVDVHARGWCILRWPGEVPPQSELAPPAPLPSSYRLASTREELRKHAPSVAQALLDLPELLPGKQRTREMVEGQLEASAGVIVLQAKEGKGEEAVGYARVVNDGEGFGFLTDLYVLPTHRKLGLGQALIRESVENTCGVGKSAGWKWYAWAPPELHGLFGKVAGFAKPKEGGRSMERFPAE